MVIASIASVNEAEAIVGRVRRVNTANFQFRLQEQELTVQTHATETISYIAWESLTGTIDGLTIEVNTTPDVVQHTFYRLVFSASFSDTPVFLADMQTADGIDTANLRWQNKTSAGIDIRVAEEQSKGTEINHMTEVVGFIAIR